jgi:hypothetical protein
MGDADTEEWTDVTVVDRRVAALRAGFAKVVFELSAKPPKRWAETFGKTVDESPEFEAMKRNPGPALDSTTITWEIAEDEVEQGWGVLKEALKTANDEYTALDEARRAKEAARQQVLDEREKKRQALDKKLKSLK